MLAPQSQPHHFAQLGAKAPFNSVVWRRVSCRDNRLERYAICHLLGYVWSVTTAAAAAAVAVYRLLHGRELDWFRFARQLRPCFLRRVSDGNIDVYRLSNLEGGMLTDIEQATNLEHAIQKNLD